MSRTRRLRRGIRSADTAPRTAPGALRRALSGIAALGMLVAAAVAVPALPASAAVGNRVLLKVLLVTAGDPGSKALGVQLDREGIPYTKIDLTTADRATVTADFLAEAATGTGKFQAVILPNAAGGGLGADELTALATYEESYGVRELDAYDFPGGSLGFTNPAYAGPLDGDTATVTDAGRTAGFSYLAGNVGLDNFDTAVTEIYGYLGVPAVQPEGSTITPLVTGTHTDSETGAVTTGSLAAIYAHGGREQLVLSAGFNEYMESFNALAPGLVDWVTRGTHLGYQRNYFNVHVDDVLLPDSRWSVSGNCTPGDDCVDANVTTTDIRMTSADVSRLLSWQSARGVKLDMVFNAGGSDAAKTANGGTDDLTTSLLANQSQFRWINHTYTHPFLGCIQIAPTVTGQSWRCATSTTDTPRQDDSITGAMSGGILWASQAFITDQVRTNQTWATTNRLTNYVADELVTGEHSGLASLPQMTTDNPFLAPALAATGIAYTGSDASRENESRSLAGGSTVTLPRHPMNVYYNTATYTEAVDEYNWYYTSAANGGGGICENNPLSTCITPLDSSSASAAQGSFTSYIQPLEVRAALRYMLTNDPRPLYVHQSNLAEDGLLYPVLDAALAKYATVYDQTKAPLIQANMRTLTSALQRNTNFRAVSDTVTAYLDASGVHLPASATPIPVTVPAGSTGTGLESYAGSLSGWSSAAQVIKLPTVNGGYVLNIPPVAPDAPTLVGVTPGSTTATVAWTAPVSDGNSPITGYVVTAYTGNNNTVAATATAAADATSLAVTGLRNGTAYRFTVAARNAVGLSAASTMSAAVTPQAGLGGVVTNLGVAAGNASIGLTWTAPSVASGITGYRVRVYTASNSVTKTVTLRTAATDAGISGLTNGAAYTVDVTPMYGSSYGPVSARSSAATPGLAAQTASAPVVTAVVPGNKALTVTWDAPALVAGSTPSGYKVTVYRGSTTSSVKSVSVGSTVRSTTVTGLTIGTAYSVQVEATYSVSGLGATSARSVAVIPVAVAPSAPNVWLALSGGRGGSITATAYWTAPSDNGGSNVTGYTVTGYRVDGNGTVLATVTSPVLSSGSRSYTMTFPSSGTAYFTVTAHNAVGAGTASAASSKVTAR